MKSSLSARTLLKQVVPPFAPAVRSSGCGQSSKYLPDARPLERQRPSDSWLCSAPRNIRHAARRGRRASTPAVPAPSAPSAPSMVHAATEGLWFMDVLGLSPFSTKQRAQLVKTILSIADGAPLTITDPDVSPRSATKA